MSLSFRHPEGKPLRLIRSPPARPVAGRFAGPGSGCVNIAHLRTRSRRLLIVGQVAPSQQVQSILGSQLARRIT